MKTHSRTDKELAKLLASNSEEAFCELYIRYKDKLWQYAYHLLKSAEETDDIIQEVFIRLWEVRNFINPELSFSSFIYTMTRNRIMNYFRDVDIKQQVEKALLLKRKVKEESIEANLITAEYQKILLDAISQLPPQRKRIFNMSRMDNLSYKEIALQLGISVNTVQEHISEALRFIKTYFFKHSDIILTVFFLHTIL